MPRIFFANTTRHNIPFSKRLQRLAALVLKGCGKGRVNIIFDNNASLRALNRQFRNLNKTTDVLSFALNEPEIFGEIYISLEKALSQAPAWGNTLYRELKRLIVHGCLHLAGYDHIKKCDREVMSAKEEFYLK
jgi:probable rRNA maturation factor